MSNAEIVVWRPPHEQAPAPKAEAQAAEADARLALARLRLKHVQVQDLGTQIVLRSFQQILRQLDDPDFAATAGPLAVEQVLKLAEFVTKNFRLDHGQATENIAHTVSPSIDFSRMTQAERDEWRRLYSKGSKKDAEAE